MMKLRILITGSTGFIGRHLVPGLVALDFEILEITRDIRKSNKLFQSGTKKLYIHDPAFKDKIFEFDPEIVVHLASYLTSSDDLVDVEELISSNLVFLSKVLNAVSGLPLKLFINTGSISEYSKGNDELLPSYFYSATKTASRSFVDYYSNAYGFKHVTVVPYAVYGCNDTQKKVINLILDSLNSESAVDLSPGDQVMDFIHVSDVVDFYLVLIENYASIDNKKVIKLGTGHGHSLREVALLVESVTQRKTRINWGAKDYRRSDLKYAVANTVELRKEFNWAPKVSLREGIIKLIS